MNSFLYLYYAYLAVVALPILAGLFGYKHLGRDMRIFWIMMIITMITEIVTLIMAFMGLNNNWVHNVFLPIESTLFTYVLAGWLSKRSEKKVVYISLVTFISLHSYLAVFILDNKQMNTVTSTLMCIYYAILASYTIFQIQKADYGAIYQDYRFWICGALLFYSAGDLTFFRYYVAYSGITIWEAHILINIATYCTYAWGFRVHIRNGKRAKGEPAISGPVSF